ncbi:helix-turn-helix transcriptional regulator [Emticicia sp. C21]|uniref:XRE family transcriptional regulator n=1 Tax=Emticicia sp. C21 TaxID=2302915 RepID=UPI000E354BB5|nr:helix-turn-helix transcriptional regulator [Emticicia sp. C21]RFS16982.1 XRE family transcriptional regulator [Emticicia sp. C21]
MKTQIVDNKVINLIDFQKSKRLKTEEVATRLGISTSLLYKLYKGERNLTDELVEKIQTIMFEESLQQSGQIERVRKQKIEVNKPDALIVSIDTSEVLEEYINTHGNRFTRVDGETIIEVPLLNYEAYARYLDEISEARIYESEKLVTFVVDKFDPAFHLAFKVYGDSMNGGRLNDTPDKAIVLGREVDKNLWFDGGLKIDKYGYGWVILTDRNILFKDIVSLDKSRGIITCHSRNPSPEYSDFELSLREVHQVFKVLKRIF